MTAGPQAASATWPVVAPIIIRGCWQLSDGHGPPWTQRMAFDALDECLELDGQVVLDGADIYGGVESLLGAWIADRRVVDRARVHTKFVPDLRELATIDRAGVREAVSRSLDRLGLERLDLVQFHWWDFGVDRWRAVAEWLAELRDEGLIVGLGVTNFDTERLGTLLDDGVVVRSNQVQLSVLDRRALPELAPFCEVRGVDLLCYGTLAGGLLGKRDPDGRPTRSHVKYELIVGELGGDGALASARAALAEVGDARGWDGATTAVAYVLSQPAVAGAIVGLSARGPQFRPPPGLLGNEEIDRIHQAVPNTVRGAVYELERDRNGPHGRIMRYDLNDESGDLGGGA